MVNIAIAEKNHQKRQGMIVKLLRTSLSMTQKELAGKLGYTQEAISLWETGETSIPNSVMPTLASILNCELNTFWE